MKTFLDWSAYDTYGIGDAYSGIPATGGNYAKAVAVCMHSRDCQKTAKGVMRPSFRFFPPCAPRPTRRSSPMASPAVIRSSTARRERRGIWPSC